MKGQEFIYRVAFSTPPLAGDDRSVFYFGSLASIYELFSPVQMGVALKTLWNKKVSDGTPFVGECVMISREPLYRKANKNGRKQGAQGLELVQDVELCQSCKKSPQIEDS